MAQDLLPTLGIEPIVGGRLIGSLLYGVEPTDPMTFFFMVTILLAVAASAGYLPARRASRTDPMVALRSE